MKYFLIIISAVLIFLISNCLSQTNDYNDLTDINSFFADPGSFQIINYKGKKNVIKVEGDKTNWAVVKYSLKEYRGREITIELTADVMREGAEGNLLWQVNNESDYPSIAYLEKPAVGSWHTMRGRLIVTPTNNEPYIYLTNWENNANNTTYYVSNPTVTITEGSILNPDLSLRSIKSVYENDFLIGNISDSAYLSGKYFDVLKHHYNTVTCTATYPVQLAPSAKGGNYQWTHADSAVNLMISNNIYVHGHILVWHEATPSWITEGTRYEAEKNMRDHITAVLTHFKGRILSWDVVNEAMRDNLSNAEVSGDWKNCVRKTETWMPNPWFDKLGPDYIELAFRIAREVDPGITLYYNDYGLENPNKAEAVRKMILDINNRYKAETGGSRNLIEGVGSQAHIYELKSNFNDMRLSLEKLISLGIEVAITELDLSMAGYVRGSGRDTVMTEKDEIAQAVYYAKLFKLYREYSANIKRVTMWGMDDGTSWISAGNPCLFNWKLNAKKALFAVIDPDGFLKQYDK